MTLYVIAYVPAASVPNAEQAIAPYLLGPGSVWIHPLSPTGTGAATHYGLCAPVSSNGQLDAALPSLKAAIPGSNYHTVPASQYNYQTDWVAWLAAAGLKAQ